MSTSPSGDFLAYVRTRFPAWLAILLPLLLVLLALRERVIDPAESAPAFVIALLLVFELRIWDDLCDLEHDRQVHPERVLCRAETVRPFAQLLLIVMAVNFALVTALRPWWSVVMFLAIHLLLAAWYAARKQLSFLGRIANCHVVLLKYPVIVSMLGARLTSDWASPPLLLSMAVVYLGLCIFEVAHDAALRKLPGSRICLAVECLVLAAVGCLAVMSAGWFRFSSL